jgi:SPP1 gp7 family putative phage head morphogenesis protein
MHRSTLYWLKAAWRKNTPHMAADELPAMTLRRAIRALARRWQQGFNTLADDLAAYFTTAVQERSDAALKASLKKAGFSIEWTMTRAQRDVVQAAVAENVALIRSIPQQYHSKVEQHVMRAVQTGRDLGPLTEALQREFGATKKRAALIARDQNNKVTAALTRARQVEIGVTEAVWLHSSAGKEPRPTHVAMHGQRYDVTKGMWDPAEQRHIFPGELINCRCVSKAVVPGFT